MDTGVPNGARTSEQPRSVEMLEVEDDEQRARRFQSVLKKLNANSNASRTPTSVPEFKFDFGERKTFAVPPSELLSRVQAFLPQMEASNAILNQKAQANPLSVDIEHVEDGVEQYVEMNLGLGVFETKRSEDAEMSSSPSSSSSMSSSSSSLSSDSSETSSDSDSDSDLEWDSDEIISSFLPSRLLRHNSDSSTDSESTKAKRLISPLPRRSLSARSKELELLKQQEPANQRSKPGIVILGEEDDMQQ